MPTKFANSRLLFPIGEQKKFLEDIIQKNNLTLNKIANITGVSNRTIRDWKRERYHITETAVRKLCYEFNIDLPNNFEQLIIDWQKYLCPRLPILR